MVRRCSCGAKAGFALALAEGALGELGSSSVAKTVAAAAEQQFRREQRAKDVADTQGDPCGERSCPGGGRGGASAGEQDAAREERADKAVGGLASPVK